VVLSESVPAVDKVVSIFEPHTDIIIKDRREVIYGHKLCLSEGGSGLNSRCRHRRRQSGRQHAGSALGQARA